MKLLKTVAIFLPLAALCAQTAKPPVTKPATPAPSATTPAAKPPTPAAKPAAAPAGDPVVLTIGAEKITKSQYETFLAGFPERTRAEAMGPSKKRFAEQYADVKALSLEARKRGLDQSPDVKAKIQFQTENVLAGALYEKLMAEIHPDDAALHAYYDKHKAENEELKARHILVAFKGGGVPAKEGQKELTDEEALAKAQALRKRIVGGEDFAVVAKAESSDTGSGANGGDLGTFGHGRMVPPFEEAAFKLPVGEVSEPVKSMFGYHIIQVQEKKSKTFEEEKTKIEQALKPEMARQVVDNIRKQTGVLFNDDYFGKPEVK